MKKYNSLRWYIVITLCLPSPINAAEHYWVDTIAGAVGSPGPTDSTTTSARFFHPSDMAIDGNDTLFIVDGGNHEIRQMTTDGAVTTLAGTGSPGNKNGARRAASFSSPFGITIDALGNRYITDSGNHMVRKMMAATGEISTIAGLAGVKGGLDGPIDIATFRRPFGTVVTADGTVYVVDSGNHAIRKIKDGVVSTFAGLIGAKGHTNGLGTDARFEHPSGIALAPDGGFYIADSQNHLIRKITAAGVVSTVAGRAGKPGSDDGIGLDASFHSPFGLVVAGDYIFVTDANNYTIRRINIASRAVSTIAGLAGAHGSVDGPAARARFYLPWGITMDSRGNIFVADYYNHTVRKIHFVNTPPVATSETVTAIQDKIFSKQLVATDAEGDPLIYSLGNQAAHGTVVVRPDGSYTYTPTAKYHGTDSFTYKVSDGYEETTATITINVAHVNAPPVAIDGSASGEKNKDITGSVPVATDVDAGPLTYKLKTAAAGGLVTVAADGKFVYRPTYNFVGPDTFTYEVEDGNGGTANATMKITVIHVNTPPVAHNGIVEGKKNKDIAGKLPKADDADGDTLTYKINTGAANGLVTVSTDGSFVYKPVHDFIGTDEFMYLVDDANGGKDTAIVRIKVKDGSLKPVPRTPVPSDDSSDDSSDDFSASDSDRSSCPSPVRAPLKAQNGIVEGKKNINIIGKLPSAIHAVGDLLTYGIETQATHGAIHIGTDGKFTYVPHHNFIGEDRFKYQVSDGRGRTALAIVKVKISDRGHHGKEGTHCSPHSSHGYSSSRSSTGSDSDD